ncbi:MAG: lysophospholipid acyltransferase family protein [Gemmatimonadaceae bacterium]
MRVFFVAIAAFVMTILLGPVVLVARLFGIPQGPASIYSRCIRLWARTVNFAAGVRVRVHNPERMLHEHGAVFIANHVSWFDVFALAAEVPWCSFVAKTELRKIPLFGFAIEAAGIVFIDRENRKKAFESYKVAAAEVYRGRAIVVCPEGTRGHDYRLRPFKKGPFVLAIAAQAPIVPTVVHGAREVMKKGSFLVHGGVVDLHFLEPISTEGMDYDRRSELMAQSWSAMARTFADVYGVQSDEPVVAKQA